MEGRNPWWREAWEELPAADREAVKRAWKQGTRVPDDRLLPFIYGLIAIERRRRRWAWLGWLSLGLLAGLWTYLTCVRVPSAFCWVYTAIDIVWIAALPTRLVLSERRVRRAEGANLSGARRTAR